MPRSFLSSINGEQDRDQQNAERNAKADAVSGLIGLTQSGKADAQKHDEDQEGADVETNSPHSMVPERLKDDHPTTIFIRV